MLHPGYDPQVSANEGRPSEKTNPIKLSEARHWPSDLASQFSGAREPVEFPRKTATGMPSALSSVAQCAQQGEGCRQGANEKMQRLSLAHSSKFGVTGGLFFGSGFAALLYQIAWQRTLFGWYGVDLDSVSVIVSIFMLGLGVGALTGGWLADRFQHQRIFVFSMIELTIGAFGFFSLGIIDSVGELFPVSSIAALIGLAFLILIIPTCAMGATLPVLVTELVERTRNVGLSTGRLYFINTFGAACGSFAAGFVLLKIGGLDGLVALAATLNCLVSAVALIIFRTNR